MYLEYTKPKPLDWTKTFSAYDKIPFGGYVLANELPKLFPEKNIQLVEHETIATFMMCNDSVRDGNDGLFFILSGETQSFSKIDMEMLLEFVENGNDVFWASEYIPCFISDTLNLWLDELTMWQLDTKDTIYATLSNPYFKNKKYHFPKQNYYPYYSYFSKFDTVRTTVLGQYKNDSTDVVNFIKTPYGKGNFYIHLLPEAFGNYYMLNDSTYSYAVNTLNYLKKNNIYCYEYKKSLTSRDNENLLMYIFGNPPLYWAWIILLMSALFYMLFAGKRVQRIIPVIKPLQNSIVEFTKTVGNMYYNSRQHNDLMQKKIKYFLFYVKETYFLDVKNIDDEFSRLLHLKSGVSQKITDKIVALIRMLNTIEYADEEDLKNLNEAIDKFYSRAKDNF